MRHHAQHVGKFAHFGAAAAELARHARLDQAGLLEQREIFGDEAVALVELGRTRGKLRRQPARDLDDPLGLSSAVRGSLADVKVDSPTMLFSSHGSLAMRENHRRLPSDSSSGTVPAHVSVGTLNCDYTGGL